MEGFKIYPIDEHDTEEGDDFSRLISDADIGSIPSTKHVYQERKNYNEDMNQG